MQKKNSWWNRKMFINLFVAEQSLAFVVYLPFVMNDNLIIIIIIIAAVFHCTLVFISSFI
jgi:hypothetical protein